MKRELRNTSKLAPFTPMPPAPPPAPTTTPDLRVEAALYAALLFERERNKHLSLEYRKLEAKFNTFRLNALKRKFRRNFVPNHNDKVTK